jgi:hypothetical protein
VNTVFHLSNRPFSFFCLEEHVCSILTSRHITGCADESPLLLKFVSFLLQIRMVSVGLGGVNGMMARISRRQQPVAGRAMQATAQRFGIMGGRGFRFPRPDTGIKAIG